MTLHLAVSVGWLVGWSVGRLVGRLVGWLVGWSVGRSPFYFFSVLELLELTAAAQMLK